ncbi:MAG: alpha/beta hydrolase [Candidatus Pacebacteria bacterium]|nr:alpha/beta hydrolase [Candidatus Paceibacterota bacterium]
MVNVRKYGNPPFNIALVHGGPGAAGEMAPVASRLAAHKSILETLQTASSLKGQVQELKSVLEEHGTLPITLVGHSWGAWLALIVAAQYPDLVRKLMLIASGPFEIKYAKDIMATRLSRLNEREKVEFQAVTKELNKPKAGKRNALGKLARLISKTDSYDPLPDSDEKIKVQQNIYQSVWPEAAEFRKSGNLLKLAAKVQCPVVAIHGDYDPHPAEGVRKPLSVAIKDFHFVLLQHCGHNPWMERKAKDKFYKILKGELR